MMYYLYCFILILFLKQLKATILKKKYIDMIKDVLVVFDPLYNMGSNPFDHFLRDEWLGKVLFKA